MKRVKSHSKRSAPPLTAPTCATASGLDASRAPLCHPCDAGQGRRKQASGWGGFKVLLGMVLAAATAFPLPAATNEPPLAIWDVAARALVGGGYQDNVLLSSIQPEHSPFVEVTSDFSVIRLSESGASLSFFLLGEFRRFLENIEVEGQPYEGEQLLYLTTAWSKPLEEQNTLNASLDYFYQYQVIDASETEVVLRRVLIRGHTLTGKLSWDHQLSRDWKVSVEGIAERQIYEAELDDYWQGAAQVRLSRAYGRKSEAALLYQLRQRFYDTREQSSPTGVPIPDTSLVYRSHEIAGEWRHYWDANRQWRTTVKAGCFLSEDNGSGYFDYNRLQLSARVRWQPEGWELSAATQAGWYLYDGQEVGNENRERSYYVLEGRIERRLAKHWLVYGAASREWNLSNDPLDEYNDWVASAGIGVEF